MGILDEIEKIVSPKPASTPPQQRTCKDCFWSDYQGVYCKLNDPTRTLTSPNEAQLGCTGYTTTYPTADDITQQNTNATETAVNAVKDGVDAVKGSTDAVTTAVNAVKGSTDLVKTSVDAVKTSTDAVTAAANNIKTSTDAVKTSADAITTAINDPTTGLKTAVNNVKSSTDAVTAAANNIKTSTDAVKTSADGINTSITGTLTTAVNNVKSSADSIKTSADNIKTSTDNMNTAVTNAVNAVKSSTDAVTSATNTVKSAVDAVKAMVARPAWYDRNATTIMLFWNGGWTGPHGWTTRWIYTVPAGRKAFVEAVNVQMVRQSNASSPSLQFASIYVNYNILISATLFTAAATSLLQDNQSIGQAMTLQAGDVICFETVDTSTGGGYSFYSGSAKVTEFDA